MHWHLLVVEVVDGVLRATYATQDRTASLDAVVALCMRHQPGHAYLGVWSGGGGLPATILPCNGAHALDCRLRWQEALDAAADRLSVAAASVFELDWPQPLTAAGTPTAR